MHLLHLSSCATANNSYLSLVNSTDTKIFSQQIKKIFFKEGVIFILCVFFHISQHRSLNAVIIIMVKTNNNCKLQTNNKLLFCVTTDINFIKDLRRKILASCHFYTASFEFPHPLYIHDGDRKTKRLSLSLRYHSPLL